jgi:cytochrome c556
MMKKMLLMVLLMVAGCAEKSDHASHAPTPAAPAPAANAVQSEMRLLTATLESAVRGIGAGDVRGVEHELHRLHAAKAATDAALDSGAYRLPKNPEGVARFRELDAAFHAGLGRLVDASQRNDVPATAQAVGVVLSGCQGCHSEFRP